MAKEKLLVVDDNPELSENIKDIFEENNFYVKTASSGKEAIKLSKKDKFRIALMDLKLPDYDGQELIKKLEEIIPSIEYIIITGYASKDSAQKAVSDEKIISYEEKPLDFTHLLYIIRQAVKRQKAEEQLRFQAMLLDQIKDLITATDLSGEIIYVNQAEARMFGVSQEELIGKQIYDYGEDETKGATQKEIFEKTVKNGGWHGEVVNYSMDGEEYILDCRTWKIKDAQGKPVALCSVSTDITERKKREERIEQLNSLLKSISNVNQLIVREDDLDKLMKKACESLVKTGSYLGCSISLLDEEDNKIKPFSKAGQHEFSKKWSISPAGKGWAPKCVKSAIRENEVQIMNNKECGSCTYREEQDEHYCVTVPMKSRNRIVGALQVGVELKEKINSEEKELLEEVTSDLAFARDKIQSEEELREKKRAVESSLNGIAITNLEGKITYVNSALLKMWGYEDKDIVLGKNVIEFFKNKKRTADVIAEMKIAGEWRGEVTGIKKDGTELSILLHINILKDKEGNPTGFLGSLINISKRKEMENIQKVLLDIANAVNTTSNLDELYKEIHRQLGEVMETKNFYIALFEEDNELIKVDYFVDQLQEKPPPPQKLKEGSLTYYVINTGESIYLTKEKREKLIEKGDIAEFDYQSKIWLGVPLKTKGRIIGALAVQSYEDSSVYSKKDLRLLEFVSDEIAIAINHKNAEVQMQESEKKYRSFFETAAEGILALDIQEEKFAFANPSACNMFGYSEDELKEISPPEIHPEDSREKIIKDREEHIQEKKVFTANVPCQKKDGTIFYANINSVNTKIGNKNYHIGFFTDVTEQKKAQEEIKRSEKELSTIYENVPLIMMLVDKERRVKKINGSGEKFTGRSAIELLGMKGGEALRCLHHLDDPRGCGFGEFCEECKVRNTVLDTFKTGEPHIKVEATLPFKIDGEKKNLTFLVSTSLLNIEEEPLVLVTILDITERKKAEKIQKRLMERVEAGLRAGNLAWWEMELPSGKVTFDARKAEVLGYSADDFETYKDFTKLLHPDDYQKAMNAMRAHLKGKAENYEIEYRIKTRDGSYKWFRDIGGIVEREDDDQTHVIGIVEDITERKKAQKELQKSEKRFRSYIEHSPDGIFVANKKGDYLSVNKAACEVTGYSKDELLDMNLLDLIPSEAKEIASKSFQTLPEKGKVSVEVPFQKKDGSLNYWIVKAVKLSENRYLGFVHIITERKEAEKRLNIAFEGTIKVISDILEVRDAYTAGHQRRVAQLAKEIADDMDIAEEKEKGLEVASSIHDLGKIIIPAQILSKPTELTDLEFSYIKQHPVVGYEILKGIEFPWSIADIVHQHHERLDGSGYPQGLEENEIMKEAKILAVADVVEAMSSQRPYRPSLGMKAALDEIKDKKGKLYDPKVVESCLEVIKSGFKFIEIKSTVLESNKK